MLNVYSRILVGYDGSELSRKALDTAIALAKNDARIELHVVTVFNPPVAMGSYGLYTQETLREMQEDVEKMVDGLKEGLNELPNKTSTHLLQGIPGNQLVEFAKDNDCDLVVIGSRGLSNMKELFLGSVSHYVVQRASCPVYVVK